MRRFKAAMAYGMAGLTIVAMVLTPFVLIGGFTRLVAALGLRVDETYTGGEVALSSARTGYRVDVYRPVEPKALFGQVGPFVQLAWTPADRLPARVRDEVDVDGDGHADLVATFTVPRDANAPLRVDVTPLSPRLVAMAGVSRSSFACLIARVGDRVVVRVPLRRLRPASPGRSNRG